MTDQSIRAALDAACRAGCMTDHAYARCDDPADITTRLRNLAMHLFKMDSGSGEGAMLMDAAKEIGRLRAVIRVNALRYDPNVSHRQIDEVIYGRR